ncbi:MAG: hypothetical protein WA744_08040 [Candidatus Acidiferrales bacterium]
MNFLILITTFAGFYLASAPETSVFRTFRIAYTLVSTLLVGGGTGTLDHFFEQCALRMSTIERIPPTTARRLDYLSPRSFRLDHARQAVSAFGLMNDCT